MFEDDNKTEESFAQPGFVKSFAQPFGNAPGGLDAEPRQEEGSRAEESRAGELRAEAQPAAQAESPKAGSRRRMQDPDTQPYTQQAPYALPPLMQQAPYTPPQAPYAQFPPYAQLPHYTLQPPYAQLPHHAPYGQPFDQQPYGAPPYGPPFERQPYGPPFERQPYGPPPYGPPFEQQQYGPPPYMKPPYMQQAPYTQQPVHGQPYLQIPPGQTFGPAPYGQPGQTPPVAKAGDLKRRKEKKRESGGNVFSRRSVAVLAVIMVIACFASGIGGGLIGSNMNRGEVINFDNNPYITIEPSNDITTTEAVAKKVLASVVGIASTGKYTSNNFFYGPSEQEFTGIGTGMIIDETGFILTNSHVVIDGAAEKIAVYLSDGQETEGKLIWNDAGLDLAVIKIEATGLIPVELGDSEKVAIGAYVAAIGNPLGLEFSGSITSGVVSGLDRTITVSDGMGGAAVTMQGLIQVDAAINSGNSGGPLLNSRGQVIGINTAKATAEGMGFAIPINTAIPIVEKVLKDGSFERVYMGISAANVEVIKEHYPNVELKADRGACITDVTPGSPAEKGGLKVKDVITAIDGKEITGADSLIKLLLGYTAGDTVTVTFNRDGEILETKVTLISQSELDQAQQDNNPFRSPEKDSGR